MIEVTNTRDLTIQPNQAITFDKVIVKTNCACFRANAPRVKLNRNGLHKITFAGNVGLETGTGTAQLTIQLGGMNLPETVMNSVTPAEGLTNHVSTATVVSVCCNNYDTVSVVNTGTAAVVIPAGAVLIAERLCV